MGGVALSSGSLKLLSSQWRGGPRHHRTAQRSHTYRRAQTQPKPSRSQTAPPAHVPRSSLATPITARGRHKFRMQACLGHAGPANCATRPGAPVAHLEVPFPTATSNISAAGVICRSSNRYRWLSAAQSEFSAHAAGEPTFSASPVQSFRPRIPASNVLPTLWGWTGPREGGVRGPAENPVQTLLGRLGRGPAHNVLDYFTQLIWQPFGLRLAKIPHGPCPGRSCCCLNANFEELIH